MFLYGNDFFFKRYNKTDLKDCVYVCVCVCYLTILSMLTLYSAGGRWIN